jgi:hypothetical protein
MPAIQPDKSSAKERWIRHVLVSIFLVHGGVACPGVEVVALGNGGVDRPEKWMRRSACGNEDVPAPREERR